MAKKIPDTDSPFVKEVTKLLSEEKFFCTRCGSKLERLEDNPRVMCGSIHYYQCTPCNRFFKFDQRGPIAMPGKLEELPAVGSTEELEEHMRSTCGST